MQVNRLYVRFANMGLVPELDDLDMNGSDDAVRVVVVPQSQYVSLCVTDTV
jgi:hypothetical protein